MRLKVLSLFLATQALSFGIWYNFSHADPEARLAAPQASSQVSVHSGPKLPSLPSIMAEAEKTTHPAAHILFSSRNMDESAYLLHSIKENQIITALGKLPLEHVKTVESVTLDYNPAMRRGLGGSNKVILRAVNMGVAEMIAVLIHEVAHNVDYGYLTHTENEVKSEFKDGPMTLYESDPSLDFFRISWNSEYEIKTTAVSGDFVSGYAMTDCFEDFAESYTFYILHNKDFKALSVTSEALHAKYRFMKYEVFGGEEFDTGDGILEAERRPWDTTVLDYDVTEFLS